MKKDKSAILVKSDDFVAVIKEPCEQFIQQLFLYSKPGKRFIIKRGLKSDLLKDENTILCAEAFKRNNNKNFKFKCKTKFNLTFIHTGVEIDPDFYFTILKESHK